MTSLLLITTITISRRILKLDLGLDFDNFNETVTTPLISKTDEDTEAASLGYILPSHEYFHQSMMIADCESELFRDSTRGLEGGAFFMATLLNRKDAKLKKGKDAIDSLKDFITLKADARFCQHFLIKFSLDPEVDNTPDLLKSASPEQKETFIFEKVELALRDLLPYFRSCSSSDPDLDDHPLQEGRRDKSRLTTGAHPRPPATSLESPVTVHGDVAAMTAQQLQDPQHDIAAATAANNIEEISVSLSATRKRTVFRCKLCNFQCRFKTVCLTHIENCFPPTASAPDLVMDSTDQTPTISTKSLSSTADPSENDGDFGDESDDIFWNYKCCEFFVDSIFCITSNYEKFGDGLGCYIINKIILPIVHGLRHSNYSNSIHRFITRVLCEATPKEGLKLIHEKFSNRAGKPGQNIHRDRRMEYRIGTAKKLIGNLGPNFSKEAVQKVKCTLDIKEELYMHTRVSHGVDIRTGRHNPRADTKDYEMLLKHLTEMKAHQKVKGRKFGNLVFKEDLMDDEKFDKVEFFRWIAGKNKEAASALSARRRC